MKTKEISRICNVWFQKGIKDERARVLKLIDERLKGMIASNIIEDELLKLKKGVQGYGDWRDLPDRKSVV